MRAQPGAHGLPLFATIAGAFAFTAVMFLAVRPLARRLLAPRVRAHLLGQDAMAIILLFALGSAWLTERLGVHALFGAFLAGAVLPRHEGFVLELTRKLEDLTVVFLLPLFFAFTGLRTSIALVSGVELWGYTLLIIAVAVAGKLGGSMLAARWTGMGWREAGAVGVLMNTRGLMELVILNIGLDIGVLSPALFSMLVVMALVTTFMTTPVLQALGPQPHTAPEASLPSAL